MFKMLFASYSCWCFERCIYAFEYTIVHCVLRPLLPFLGNLIHDRTKSVRTVIMQLRVKEFTPITYYHMVRISNLMARLAAERHSRHNAVVYHSTALSLPSFFPPGQSGTCQMIRNLVFLVIEPAVAVISMPILGTLYYSNSNQPLAYIEKLAV